MSESRIVLTAFNDLHRTWFPADDSRTVLNAFACGGNNHLVIDQAEAALHFTRVMFGANIPFKEAFTSPIPMEAVRSSTVSGGTVQQGPLAGIRPLSSTEISKTITVQRTPTSVRYKESLGGGFLGTKSFLSLNLGATRLDQAWDGGISMPRRWAKAGIESALCRTLPILRKTDVVNWVNTASTIPFRRAAACMTCHTTMDSMAGVARNVSPRQMSTSVGCSILPFGPIATVTQAKEAELDSGTVRPDSDANFSARPPTGRLIYRSFDGSLKDLHGSDLNDLMTELVNQDDIYVCAAKRYFEYFTGISVNLQDPGDTELTPLSAADIHYKNQVVQLGRSLRSNNSLRSLIQSILSLPVYAKPSQRDSN
jgi:hypothetical protein